MPATLADRRPLTTARFVIDPVRDRWIWSPEMFRIHGYGPQAVQPSADLTLQHAADDYRGTLERILVWCGSHEATPFVNHRRVVDVDGFVHEVAVAGIPRRDDRGFAVGLDGVMFDFGVAGDDRDGEEETVSEHLLRCIGELQAAVGSRDLIGRAKGILIATLSLDSDTAFQVLSRASQTTNRKVAEIARSVVAAAGPDGTAMPDDVRAAIAAALRA